MEVKLNRTGKRPMAFIGDEIYNGNTKDHASTRWDVVRIFRAEQGFYVVGIARLTCWEGERDFYSARKFETKEALMEYVSKRLFYLKQTIEGSVNMADLKHQAHLS